MAEPDASQVAAPAGFIDAYLTELAHSVAHIDAADDIVDEAADHLLFHAGALEAAGRTRAEAETLAVARFGSAPLVARAHAAQAAMGSAVSTRATRRAGLVMLFTVPVAIVGILSNTYGEAHSSGWRGSVHGSGAAVEVLSLILLLMGLWGLRKRFGGLGGWGRAALILTCAAPFIAAPFGWGAGGAFAVVLSVAMVVLLLGAWMTPVLPRTPIALMGFGVVATALATITVPWDQGPLALYLPGSVAFAMGYLMLGWTMWNEPALDARSGSVPPPSFA